ncbi:MAG: ABC transporter substrate-binding protein [Thermoprotei archaeon]|nr:MAG: ABC transporter substrate-binding protein [Thermoprotei archaeon]
MIVVSFANLPYLDPHVAHDESGRAYIHNVYDTLVSMEYKEGTVKIVPWLAEKWEVSEDGLIWTFYLRKGVKFHHSGREVTAEDVVFSVMRMVLMPEGMGYLLVPWVDLNKTKVIDKYTLQIGLKKPCGVFLYLASYIYIVDSKEVQEHIKCPGPYGKWCDFGKGWLMEGHWDVGSGPYMLAEYVPGSHVLLAKNKDWWGEFAPHAPEKVRIVAIVDPTPTLTLMSKRELDISTIWLPPEAYEELDKIEGIDIAHLHYYGMYFLMMNTRKPPLDDIHVRKALFYLFDYKTFLEIMPQHKEAKGVVPSNMIGFCPFPEPVEFNIDKALEELKKSKYWGELDKYEITITWRAEVPGEDRVGLLLASAAEQVGLKIKVVKLPWLTVVERMTHPDTPNHIEPMWITADYPEAIGMIYLRWHSSSQGTVNQNEWFEDPLKSEIDKKIEDVLSTMDMEERLKKECELQHYIFSLYPSVFAGDFIGFKAYQSYYLEWPAAEKGFVGVFGWDVEYWKMNLYLDKKAELLGK